MERLKKLFIVLVVLLGVYYMYLTHVSQIYQISGTYYAKTDDYTTVIMEYDGITLSTYFVNPATDIIAIRADYKVGYRKYTEDIIGNFWSDDGLEPLGLRGSDVAGRLYAECVGYAIWPVNGDMTYFDHADVLEMEEAEDTTYSFGSHFAIKADVLRVYDYATIDFQKTSKLPEVEAEIVRLMDSLCPPVF